MNIVFEPDKSSDLDASEGLNAFETDQNLESECSSDLNDVLKDTLILTEKEAAAAFLAIFFILN